MGLTVHTNFGQFIFEGPFTSTDFLRNASGVYVISTLANGFHTVIDVGESGDIKSRVINHDRGHLWSRHAIDRLYVSAYYCNEADRLTVERYVRVTHNPSCGDR